MRAVTTTNYQPTQPRGLTCVETTALGTWGPPIPVTAVTGVSCCDAGRRWCGNTTARPCRSKSIGSWRGRMDDNDSVKEVRQL